MYLICTSIVSAKPAAKPDPQIYFPNSYVYPYYNNYPSYYPYYYYANSLNSPNGAGGWNGYGYGYNNWLYPQYTTTYWMEQLWYR